MGDRRIAFTDPNVAVFDGPDRILHVPFAHNTAFSRRGGKAVDLHHRYQAADANSSNLAGFAEVEAVGVANGRPDNVEDGDLLPVNFALEKTCVFPTTGRVAVEADRGKDFDILSIAGLQYINLNAQVHGVLRVSRIITVAGDFVSCTIPSDLRYGNI